MVQVLTVSPRENIQSREKGNKLTWPSDWTWPPDWTWPGLSERTETSMERAVERVRVYQEGIVRIAGAGDQPCS